MATQYIKNTINGFNELLLLHGHYEPYQGNEERRVILSTGLKVWHNVGGKKYILLNFTIYNHLDKARKLEDNYVPLKDPSFHRLQEVWWYSHLSSLHMEYIILRKIKNQPELLEHIHQSNPSHEETRMWLAAIVQIIWDNF